MGVFGKKNNEKPSKNAPAPQDATGQGEPSTSTDESAKPAKKGGNPIFLVATILLALASIAFIAYPYVSNWMYQLAMSRVSYQQAEAVEQAPKEDLSAMLKKARAYNKRLSAGEASTVVDPYGSGKEKGTKEYRSLLDLKGDGVMGSISIPKANVLLPIYHGVTEKVLQEGVGHLPGTGLPVGGKTTHCVLTGHSGLPSTRIFDDINKLEKGDWFVISVLGKDLAYEVYRIDTVLPKEVDSLAIQKDKDLVTLVTCTPYGINTHRLLVHAKRIKVPQEWYDMLEEGDRPPRMFTPSVTTPVWIYGLFGLGLGIVVLSVILFVRWRRRKKKERKAEE